MNVYRTKSDVYKNDAHLCVEDTLRSPIGGAVKTHPKSCDKPRFSHIFHSASISSHRILNRRAGCESRHNCATFSYTSPFCTVNIYTLNGSDSLMWCVWKRRNLLGTDSMQKSSWKRKGTQCPSFPKKKVQNARLGQKNSPYEIFRVI